MNNALPQKVFVLWFTGLPCSGKTTLSNAVKTALQSYGVNSEQLDGDVVRQKKTSFLGYTAADRMANVTEVASQASRFVRNGVVTLVSLISPYRLMRERARQNVENFVEIYVRCPLEICELRDVKGMYRLAREGKINHFTGISDPYEEPVCPELIVDTHHLSIDASVSKVMAYLKDHALLSQPSQDMTNARKGLRDVDD